MVKLKEHRKKKKGCEHKKLKRKFIEKGKGPGTNFQGFCSQQCKKIVTFDITQEDILEVYPKGRPKNR